ncbi:MAG: hypothetical protein AAF851_13420 [Myxococcota bacterium]
MEDFHPGGWATEDGLAMAAAAVEAGVDLLDPMSFEEIAPGATVPWSEDFTKAHVGKLKETLPSVPLAASARTAPDFDTSPAEGRIRRVRSDDG